MATQSSEVHKALSEYIRVQGSSPLPLTRAHPGSDTINVAPPVGVHLCSVRPATCPWTWFLTAGTPAVGRSIDHVWPRHYR